jgi:hypothetical protein
MHGPNCEKKKSVAAMFFSIFYVLKLWQTINLYTSINNGINSIKLLYKSFYKGGRCWFSDLAMSRRYQRSHPGVQQANTELQCTPSNKPDITHLLLYCTSTSELFGHKLDPTTILFLSSHHSGVWQSKWIHHPTEYNTKSYSATFFSLLPTFPQNPSC